MKTKILNSSLTIITFLVAVISCRKADVYDLNIKSISGVNGGFLIGYESHNQSGSVTGTATFKYENNRIVKRDGYQITIQTATGPSTMLINGIYDTVEYISSNRIIITTRDTLSWFTSAINKREIFTDGRGIITKKITYADQTVDNDTIYYNYDSDRKLLKTEQYFTISKIVRDFIYDNNSNLQKITRTFIDRNSSYTSQDTEVFGGYDSKANPLKGQCLWPDILYRTLSKNNFSTYLRIGTNCLNPIRGCYADTTQRVNWALQYDSQGNLIFQ